MKELRLQTFLDGSTWIRQQSLGGLTLYLSIYEVLFVDLILNSIKINENY